MKKNKVFLLSMICACSLRAAAAGEGQSKPAAPLHAEQCFRTEYITIPGEKREYRHICFERKHVHVDRSYVTFLTGILSCSDAGVLEVAASLVAKKFNALDDLALAGLSADRNRMKSIIAETKAELSRNMRLHSEHASGLLFNYYIAPNALPVIHLIECLVVPSEVRDHMLPRETSWGDDKVLRKDFERLSKRTAALAASEKLSHQAPVLFPDRKKFLAYIQRKFR